jgi:hypothetical protein
MGLEDDLVTFEEDASRNDYLGIKNLCGLTLGSGLSSRNDPIDNN